MKKSLLIGALGIMAVLFSSCTAKNDELLIPVESIKPTAAYQEIYGKIMEEKEGDAVTFSLILLDDDNTPELVVCDREYGTYSIYTVKDGAAFCMMDTMNTEEMIYFERTGITAQFARWNGGGDEGGYGWYYYQVSRDKTLTDDAVPDLHFTYDAVYDEEGNWTGEGITKYYQADREIDETTYMGIAESLGIAEGNKKLCADQSS